MSGSCKKKKNLDRGRGGLGRKDSSQDFTGNFLCTYYDAFSIKRKHITSLCCFWFADVNTSSYRLSKWFPTQCHVTLEVWGITAFGGYLAWFSEWIHQQVWEISTNSPLPFWPLAGRRNGTAKGGHWPGAVDKMTTLVCIGCTAAVLSREVKLAKGITSNVKTGFAMYESI